MKLPLPRSQDEKAEAYLRVMLEIKARFEVLSLMQAADWPLNLRLEVCYLQLRHICDLVTVGALVVQGDYSPQLCEGYAPGKIFRMLERKYEGSFPQAATIAKTVGSVKVTANCVPNAMTKNGLIDLWNNSGDRLHRLKISKFFRSYDTSNLSNPMEEVALHIAKLRALLDCHIVPMHNPKTLVLVTLFDEVGDTKIDFIEYKSKSTVSVRPYTGKGTTNFFRD